MELLTYISAVGLDYMLLLFMRVSGITLSSPIFGRQNIPNIAKISFTLALTYFFFTVMADYQPVEYASLLEYAVLCAREMLVGLFMGYILTLFFSSAFVAGQLVDMQMGFGMANVFDEQSNASVPLLGNMINVMMMLLFAVLGGFERLMMMMEMTLRAIPVGHVTVNWEVALVILELFCNVFVMGVQMAMPIIASSLLGEVVLGVMVRAVPQMNVFVIGLPLRVLLGLVMLVAVLPLYASFTGAVFERMFAGMEQAFAGLAAG